MGRVAVCELAYYYSYYLRLLVMATATSAKEWLLAVTGAGTRLSITTIKCTHWTLVLARLAPFQVGYKVTLLKYVNSEESLSWVDAENRRVKPRSADPAPPFSIAYRRLKGGERVAYYYSYYLRLLVMATATSAKEWLLAVTGAGTRLSITTIKCTHWTLVLARLAPFQVGYKVQSDYLRESPEMMPKMQG